MVFGCWCRYTILKNHLYFQVWYPIAQPSVWITKWSVNDLGRVYISTPCTHEPSTPCRSICVESGEYIKIFTQFLSLSWLYFSPTFLGSPPRMCVVFQSARDVWRAYLSTSISPSFSGYLETTTATSKVAQLWIFPIHFLTSSSYLVVKVWAPNIALSLWQQICYFSWPDPHWKATVLTNQH